MESPHEDLLNAYYAAMVRSATSADLELLDETFCDEMLRNESVSKNIFDEKEAEDNISLVARDLCRVDDFVKTVRKAVLSLKKANVVAIL